MKNVKFTYRNIKKEFMDKPRKIIHVEGKIGVHGTDHLKGSGSLSKDTWKGAGSFDEEATDYANDVKWGQPEND